MADLPNIKSDHPEITKAVSIFSMVIYKKEQNGNEMETGNRNEKLKLETEIEM